jgi:hypothetical protein
MSEGARSAAARRTAITAQIQADTAIDEAMIERLVRGFYERVRDDNVLGPIFAAKIEDWEPHLWKMCAFWSVGLADERTLPRPAYGQAPAAADQRPAFRSLAGAVRGSRARSLSAKGGRAFRDAGAADRRQSGAGRRRRPRSPPPQRRAVPAG